MSAARFALARLSRLIIMSHFALPTMRLGAMAADVISCRKQLGLPVLASHFLLYFVPAITSRWRDVAYLGKAA